MAALLQKGFGVDSKLVIVPITIIMSVINKKLMLYGLRNLEYVDHNMISKWTFCERRLKQLFISSSRLQV